MVEGSIVHVSSGYSYRSSGETSNLRHLLITCLLLLVCLSGSGKGQTLVYHVDNPSNVSGAWLLSTSSPAGTVWTISSQSLPGAAPGEYFIGSFSTAAGDPGKGGTIPSGSTVTFTISMQESKSGGTIFPRAKLYLNSASGTPFCVGTGTTAITSSATRYTFSCSTTAAINMASTDRLFLWVGINMTKAPSAGGSLTANLQFNGSQGSVTDSTVLVPVPAPPIITSLSPTSGNAGTPVTISGAHFGSATGTITFNGVTATVSSWTDTAIGTSVPTLASTGNVVVTNANGASNGLSFSVPPPTITSFSIPSGIAGNVVTINGGHFGLSQGSGSVTFNGTAATVSSWNDSSISTMVPALATAGNVVVTAANGELSGGISFTIPAPIISNINPDFARAGASITITGSNFGLVQGALNFNGTMAVPSSWNNNQIVAPVPSGATTGPVGVTQGGTATLNFTVDPPPSIASISPSSGPANTSVIVSGSGFGVPQDTGTVQFNGTTATPFSWSDGSITVAVPVGATSGPIVVNAGGTSSNGITFVVTPAPSITSLSASSGAAGAAVTVSGQNFGSSQGGSVVRFNGLPTTVTSWSGNSIVLTVPTGVTTGPVTVTVSGRTSNGVTFTAVTTGTLSGTVSNSGGGGAIGGANIQALQNTTVKASAQTTNSGAYSIPNLPSGNYDLETSASSFGTALTNSVAVNAGQTTTANFSLSLPGTISGKVTQADGVSAISGAQVQYFVGSASGGTVPTDSNGSYSISTLNSGPYVLQTAATGYVPQSQTVSVTAGNTSTQNFLLQPVGVNPINYVYDELGRLVSVIDSSGDTATYKYDAVGNILSISRQNSNQVAIISFTPQTGSAGTSVTINGTGFSATASQDSVNFNGTSATVISATATQINATVPTSATTGPITVTTPSGTVSSGSSFTVLTSLGAPTITGFTPNVGTPGKPITVNGTNFDVPPNDNLTFNVTPAVTANATSTQINTVIPLSTASGRIMLLTPAGMATSTQDFYIPFGTYGVTDIGFTGRMAIGSTATATIGASGAIGLILFDGTQGQQVSVQTSGGTFVSCALYLIDPEGNQRASTACNTPSAFVDAQTLPWTGTYTLGIDTFRAGSGNLSLTLNNATDVRGRIISGVPVNITTTAPGQNARYTFTATANQQVSISITNSTYTGGCLSASVLKPDSNPLTSVSICSSSGFIDSTVLPATGTYTLLIDPPGTSTGSVGALLSIFSDISGSIISGTPVNVSTNSPGQNARYTFSGTAGQQASLNLTNSTYTPGCLVASILRPDGSTLGSITTCSSAGFLDSTTLPVTGTYTVLIDPQGTSTGSAAVTLSLFNDISGPIAAGTPLNVSTTAPGQNAVYTFSATAGQQVSVSATTSTYPGCSAVTMSILNPDGTTLGSGNYCGSSGLLGSLTLSASGTYSIVFNPLGSGTGSVTLLLSMFNDVTGSITPGTPITFSTSVPGQKARYTFSGTAGQVISTEVAGFAGGNFTLSLLNPDGSTLASTCCISNQGSMTGKVLATSGAYQIVISPSVTGSATVSLITQTTNGTVNFNTPVSTAVNTTSLIGLNFSGTAGQVISAEAAGLNGTFSLVLLNPDGSQLGSSLGSGTLNSTGKKLTTTGTYQVVIIPNNGVTGSLTVSLISQTSNSSINFNTPASTTLNTTSLVGLSFSGSAGQIVSAEGAGLSGNFWLILLNPDGSQLASTLGSGTLNVTGKALATSGTYQIVIIPTSGVTGSLTVSLISQSTNDVINFNSPVTNTLNTTSLIGLSFSGTAGQIVSAEAAGLSGNFWLMLLKPDGSQLASSLGSGTLNLTGKTLGTTGTYQVVVIPTTSVTGTVTLSLISQTTNGSISVGTSVTNTISAGSLVGLTFSGSSGQTVSVQITPSLSGGRFSAYLLNPDGSTLTSTSATSSVTFSGKILGSTGTYQIVIAPNNGVTGSTATSLTSP